MIDIGTISTVGTPPVAVEAGDQRQPVGLVQSCGWETRNGSITDRVVRAFYMLFCEDWKSHKSHRPIVLG